MLFKISIFPSDCKLDSVPCFDIGVREYIVLATLECCEPDLDLLLAAVQNKRQLNVEYLLFSYGGAC
jgi:hypothetical protein